MMHKKNTLMTDFVVQGHICIIKFDIIINDELYYYKKYFNIFDFS